MNLRLLSRSAFGLAAAVIVFHSTAAANNVADGYYVFGASAGQPSNLDGSWVEFSGDTIVNWDLVDVTALANASFLQAFQQISGDNFGYPADFPPLTASNSSVISVLTYASPAGPQLDEFSFEIASPQGANLGNDIFFFSGGNNLNGGTGTDTALYDGMTFNQVQINAPDPMGSWTFDLTQPGLNLAAAPDGASTLVLGLAALAGLAACGRRWVTV